MKYKTNLLQKLHVFFCFIPLTLAGHSETQLLTATYQTDETSVSEPADFLSSSPWKA